MTIWFMCHTMCLTMSCLTKPRAYVYGGSLYQFKDNKTDGCFGHFPDEIRLTLCLDSVRITSVYEDENLNFADYVYRWYTLESKNGDTLRFKSITNNPCYINISDFIFIRLTHDHYNLIPLDSNKNWIECGYSSLILEKRRKRKTDFHSYYQMSK